MRDVLVVDILGQLLGILDRGRKLSDVHPVSNFFNR